MEKSPLSERIKEQNIKNKEAGISVRGLRQEQDQEDKRHRKGAELVASGRVVKEGDHWLVRSQNLNKSYVVILLDKDAICTCKDYERRHKPCKHIMAVREVAEEHDPTRKELSLDIKVTYPQDWSSYNKAQINEKPLFMKFLYELLQTVEDRERDKKIRGRKPLSLQDMVFASALKVYSMFSLRRSSAEMKDAERLGYIDRTPYFSSISGYMNKPELTHTLQKLVGLSALPLRSVESHFSVDSTGFRITRFSEYCVEKHNTKREHQWLKVHLTCGDKTNVVTAVEVSDQNGSDTNYFVPLIERTHREGFIISEVNADKAYSSRGNVDYVDSVGGVAYIPFRSNATGKARGSLIWKKMFNYYMLQHEEFMDHYHLRSNVESTNAMIKSKFTDLVRSKNPIAQINEILLKILCHNIVVLIQSMYELGIEPDFLDLEVD